MAAGETSRTTAHLTAVLDDGYDRLEGLFGQANARLAAESHLAAISRIEAIVRAERIDCDFERVDGYLVASTDEQRKDLDKEREAAKRAGFADLEALSSVPVQGIRNIGPALRFPQQAAFHITNYIKISIRPHGRRAASSD